LEQGGREDTEDKDREVTEGGNKNYINYMNYMKYNIFSVFWFVYVKYFFIESLALG